MSLNRHPGENSAELAKASQRGGNEYAEQPARELRGARRRKERRSDGLD